MDANEFLLYEHKIIFQLLEKLRFKIDSMRKSKDLDARFIDLFTDFFTTYIDIYHHGKEENLMFEKLKKKQLSQSHKEIIDLLLKQHNLGRELVEKIIILSAENLKGKSVNLQEILDLLEKFHKLYIEHAALEDNSFFPQAINYFKDDEKEQLLQDFFKFNIKLIDQKYKALIEMI
jgi:hemerythrin-like domain-containing protein